MKNLVYGIVTALSEMIELVHNNSGVINPDLVDISLDGAFTCVYNSFKVNIPGTSHSLNLTLECSEIFDEESDESDFENIWRISIDNATICYIDPFVPESALEAIELEVLPIIQRN